MKPICCSGERSIFISKTRLVSIIRELPVEGDFIATNSAKAAIYKEIVKIQDRAYLPKPPIDKIGIVCGILALNDEVEVIVRFPDGLDQLSKTELCGDYILVEKAEQNQ